jgi:D-cysteine desulfhydrase family pyridoxal phosphate-dependent enzyme
MKRKFIKPFLTTFFILLFVFSLFSCRPMAPVEIEEGKPPAKRVKFISERGLDKQIEKFRHVKLAHLPVPMERMKALSSEFNGPALYIKRDDQTALAFGGNKARKLEFIIADALMKKSDVFITSGGIQSNWCRQTAAAARAFGIKPILVLFKRPEAPAGYDGNLLLDFILDADIRIIEPKEDEEINTGEIISRIAEDERKKGHNPYISPVGGSRAGGSMMEPLGAISYTKAFLEIYRDAKKKRIRISHIVLATGSGGTQAGLIVGAKALGSGIEIVGISVSREKASVKKNVSAIANDTAEALGLKMTFSPEEVVVFDEYLGEGYGILNQEIADAIRLVAKKEGIILDPVYTGKAMVGLLDLIKKGYFTKGDGVVFLHTGGTPALFVYKEKLLELLKDKIN